MRVSDTSLVNSYMSSLADTKERLLKIQQQTAAQKQVLKPSDSPLGNSKIMRFSNEIDSLDTYIKNIDDSVAVVDSSINAMSGIQQEVDKVLLELTSLNSATADDVLDTYASKIDQAINTILDYSNADFKGNSLFSGTDLSGSPFGFNSGDTAVEMKLNDIGGEQNVNISSSANQKINITGEELFMPVKRQLGNINSGAGIGVDQTTNSTIYDADGNNYNLELNYTQTAANTYNLEYIITDSGGGAVANNTGSEYELIFNSTSGELQTIDGSNPNGLHIQIPANKIDFVLDTSEVTEQAGAANLSSDNNLDVDIFNTLISIRDNLNAGIRPNEEQVRFVNEFNSHITSKLSEAGNIRNRLEDTQTLLTNQSVSVQELLSNEQDVDMARLIVDLQQQEYNLNVFYKMSSMILPKSLLDFL